MTDQTKLSEKVTPTLLDRMYGNFVKLTDWVVKGEDSQYPMPKALAWLFKTTKTNSSEIDELKGLVTALQNNLIQKEQAISHLQNHVATLNEQVQHLTSAPAVAEAPAPIVAEVPTPAVAEAPAPIVAEVPTPAVAEAPTPELGELTDLDVAVPPSVSPNEQAIQVSAQAIDAGNLDPASFQALDAEISALLG